MSNMKVTATPAAPQQPSFFASLRHKLPKDTGIFVVMVGIALIFEMFGWYVRDQSFLLNTNRLILIVLQVAIIGIIAYIAMRLHEWDLDRKHRNRHPGE